ncbi:uncharacterized protein LOC133844683 [Drosophila sulfurigaster albostrigata]|uniref:uncharacterized protein LOC133844683 n=1 Tax=Drosophila sulfurigaster albostrigata TaxID=89887 RepID=UPI002D21A498|nr:uncharacterized protein LOC133844683 [Drosophila sulfurigaster albostrigata]
MQQLSKALNTFQFYVTLAVVLASAANTIALECYVCSYTLNQSDATCLTNATAGRAINCSMKYCLTVRQEMIHNANKVNSFLRDCQDKPRMLNGVLTDPSYRTYYRSCQQNLCNGHNGRVYNTSGHIAAGGGGGGGVSGAVASGNHNAIIAGKSGSPKARTSLRDCWLLLMSLLVTVISVECMR